MAKGISESLSPREFEVLRLVKPGFQEKAIARQLAISPATVKVHLRAIRTKMGVSSSVDAAAILARERPDADLSDGTTPSGIAGSPSISEELTTIWGSHLTVHSEIVREASASAPPTFDFRPQYAPEIKGNRNGLSTFHRLSLIIAMIVGLVLAIVAAPALYDSTQRVANAIDPPH